MFWHVDDAASREQHGKRKCSSETQTQGGKYANSNKLGINEPAINNSEKLETSYTHDKRRINFGFITSPRILEQSAETFVPCFR